MSLKHARYIFQNVVTTKINGRSFVVKKLEILQKNANNKDTKQKTNRSTLFLNSPDSDEAELSRSNTGHQTPKIENVVLF